MQKANLAFRKQLKRKHSKSQTRKMTRRLLKLLGKILKEIRKTERAYKNAQSLLTSREKGDLEIITKMYRQQKNHFQSIAGGLLKREYAHRKVLSQGELCLCH